MSCSVLAASLDVDTPEALRQAGGVVSESA